MNTGNSFRNAAQIEPRRACCFVGSTQRALHDVLVGAPVPQTDHRCAEQHAEPRVVVVEVPRHAAGFLHRSPGPFHSGRHERLPEVEHLRTAESAELAPAAQCMQSEHSDQQRTKHQDARLHGLRVGHRPQAAENRVEAGQHDHQNRADPETVERANPHLRQQHLEHDATGKNAHRHLRDDVGDQRNQRQHPAAGRIEAPFEKLRHREHLRPHVERHEHPRQHQQAPGMQLVMRHGHAVGRTRPGQAHQVLRTDVRCEDRTADDPPAQIASRQEVVVSRVTVLQNDPPGQAEQDRKVDRR